MVSDTPGCHLVAERRSDGWHVPGQPAALDMHRAMLALLIAEVHAVNPPPHHPVWAQVADWRRQLAYPHLGGD